MSRRVEIPWLTQALALSEDLEGQGIPYEDPEHKAALLDFITTPTDAKCECGAELQVYQRTGGTCEKCRDRYLNQDHSRVDTLEYKMGSMNVAPRYYDCTLSNWRGEVPEAYDDWLSAPLNRNLYIFGRDTGAGKSHLAVAALYSLFNQGRRCYWYSSAVLAQKLAEETFLPEKKVEHKASWVEYLVVDDLGKNEDAVVPKGFEKVAALLDLRDQRRRPTILTSNMTPGELKTYYPALGSRLLSGVNLEWNGEDRRWASG